MSDQYTNQKELAVISMRRSGHHAIINWILSNTVGVKCFMNNAIPNTNPFESGSRRNSYVDEIDRDQEQAGFHKNKELIVYNYEDTNLPGIFGNAYRTNHDSWIGTSKELKTLFVLRDPFNLIASKLRWYKGNIWQPNEEDMMSTPTLWKTYAQEYLGSTNYLPNKYCIVFNMWFSDQSYREKIALDLELQSSDKGVEEVAKWGPNTWGDSFDGMKYDGKAQEMKVLDRWKFYKNDELYRKLLSDSELLKLSEAIFGYIPGTETLWQANTI